jgi:HD-GYP domain-containing protein (c-di-GMP phosphodiesterase class II)
MFFIRDLGSRNGIMVNEMNIEDELLRDGDILRIASFVLVFEGTASTADGHDQHFYGGDHDPAETMVMSSKDLAQDPVGDDNSIHKANRKMAELTRETEKGSVLMEKTLDLLTEYIDVQEVFIFLLEPGHRLAQKAYRSSDNQGKGKASRSIVLRAIKEKQPIVTANAKDDFRFKGESSILLKNVTSVLCCPMIAIGQEMGVVYLNNGPMHKAFNKDSAEIVLSIATQLAMALKAMELRFRESNVSNRSVKLVAEAVERFMPTLKGRGNRVATTTQILGKLVGLKRHQLSNLHVASHLHHLGYMETSKGHEFDLDETQNDLKYPAETVKILKEYNCYNEAMPIIENHRFRLDGKGVPKKIHVPSWSVESQLLALAVMIDNKLNLPLTFGAEPEAVGKIAERIIHDGTHHVTRPIIKVFEKAWKKGLILNS